MRDVDAYILTLDHYKVDEDGEYHKIDKPLMACTLFDGRHYTNRSAMLAVDLDALYKKIKHAVIEECEG